MSEPNIPPEKIVSSPMEKGGMTTVAVKNDPLMPDPIYAQRLGLIGKLVGGGSEKPGNIAVLAIVCGVILIGCGFLGLMLNQSEKSVEGLKLLIGGGFSLVTGALGYVFGSGGRENHD